MNEALKEILIADIGIETAPTKVLIGMIESKELDAAWYNVVNELLIKRSFSPAVYITEGRKL